jgi:LCP family protein required for cell wall assembly
VPGSNDPFTVLLLGSDNDAKFSSTSLLTQSMILVRVVPATKQVTMLSIPRDLYVPINGGGTAKIDTAFAYGGARSAIATVQNNFHVHVDHYVWIGLKGLTSLIDKVGGVDVVTSNPVLDDFYPADLTGGNPYDYQRVAVLPGAQHLDGLHALEYVRSRHGDLREDFGRSERQQQVLVALRAKVKTLSVTNLPDIAAALGDQLTTDLGISQVANLLPLAGGIATENIQHVLLLPPYTSGAQVGDQDVVMPNWSLIRPLVAQTFPA